MTYRACGMSFQSDIPFPELTAATPGKAKCTLSLAPPDYEPADGELIARWHIPGGRPWVSIWRTGAGFLLDFPDLVEFQVSADGSRVACRPRAATAASTVRHLFLDQVLPLILSLQGSIVLHASAVRTLGGAAAFVGPSGRGKSTLALACAQAGYPLLTDDCLLLAPADQGIAVLPSYPGVRAWKDTIDALFARPPHQREVAQYTSKKRVPVANAGDPSTWVPLRRIYFLHSGQTADAGVSIEPLRRRDSLIELIRHTFIMDIQDPIRLRAQFEALAGFASPSLYFSLEFPREYAFLPHVVAAITRHCERP